MTDDRPLLDEAAVRALAQAPTRPDLWVDFVRQQAVRTVAEVGVYRGAFAQRMLDGCPGIERYYLVDPWRHLDDWNKPANRKDAAFERFHAETLERTAAHADRRVVLRGKTLEVVDRIPDASLDLAYVDGDHTLRGVTVDLVSLFPKIREGGFLAGDDFCRTIFQHDRKFEPTLVFPFAVYFAEAVGARIYALPHRQFLMQKVTGGEHAFVDLAGGYRARTLGDQLARRTEPATAPAPTLLSRIAGRARRPRG